MNFIGRYYSSQFQEAIRQNLTSIGKYIVETNLLQKCMGVAASIGSLAEKRDYYNRYEYDGEDLKISYAATWGEFVEVTVEDETVLNTNGARLRPVPHTIVRIGLNDHAIRVFNPGEWESKITELYEMIGSPFRDGNSYSRVSMEGYNDALYKSFPGKINPRVPLEG